MSQDSGCSCDIECFCAGNPEIEWRRYNRRYVPPDEGALLWNSIENYVERARRARSNREFEDYFDRERRAANRREQYSRWWRDPGLRISRWLRCQDCNRWYLRASAVSTSYCNRCVFTFDDYIYNPMFIFDE